MKEKKIEYLQDFLSNSKIFFEGLYDYGNFRKDEFHKYTRTVYYLSKLDLSAEEKYKIVITIWEISFEILSYLMYHKNPEDVFFIDNLEDDDVRQIKNILYYSSNWFSYGKEIDKSYLVIGSWK